MKNLLAVLPELTNHDRIYLATICHVSEASLPLFDRETALAKLEEICRAYTAFGLNPDRPSNLIAKLTKR